MSGSTIQLVNGAFLVTSYVAPNPRSRTSSPRFDPGSLAPASRMEGTRPSFCGSSWTTSASRLLSAGGSGRPTSRCAVRLFLLPSSISSLTATSDRRTELVLVPPHDHLAQEACSGWGRNWEGRKGEDREREERVAQGHWNALILARVRLRGTDGDSNFIATTCTARPRFSSQGPFFFLLASNPPSPFFRCTNAFCSSSRSPSSPGRTLCSEAKREEMEIVGGEVPGRKSEEKNGEVVRLQPRISYP